MVDGAALEKRCAQAPRVRIPPSPPSLDHRRAGRERARPVPLSRGRGRLVDYGAALEMRFGATRRGFESLPLRHTRLPRGSADAGAVGPAIAAAALFFGRRARRGTSGALYLQSAPAGLNSLPRSPLSNAARRSDVEDRVPRSGEPRTVSGPEGSSTKRPSSGAAERPGPSRSPWWARGFPDRRRVHGNSSPRALHWRRS